jgi:hypothetical protein
VLLVAAVVARFERDGLVPEHAQHPHPVAVVPRRGRHGAAGPRHANHLAHRSCAVGNEVEHEQRKRVVERTVRELKLLRIADREYQVGAGMTALRKLHVAHGWINPNNAARRRRRGDCRRQRART